MTLDKAILIMRAWLAAAAKYHPQTTEYPNIWQDVVRGRKIGGLNGPLGDAFTRGFGEFRIPPHLYIPLVDIFFKETSS